ncbi:MAG: hypothetical protein LBG99_03335 [Propionibacteriaceae bacterium]|nr:hypothetical protein [Propionibacteriaceae bacterium]
MRYELIGTLSKVDAGTSPSQVNTAKPSSCLRSFTADTPVLMGDGTRKPIGDIQAGDSVTAFDPGTGVQSVETVTATWPHTDDVVILTLGDGTTIETTASHPWWVDSKRAYVRTDHLEPGDLLLTADGSTLTVRGMSRPHGEQIVYNLTVTGPHTYYVGNSEINVHNFTCPRATFTVDVNGTVVPVTPPRFMADANGTVIPTSRTELEEGLQRVATSSRAADRGSGIIYTLPDGTTARVMDADGYHVERVLFGDANANPVDPFTGRVPQSPRPKPSDWSQQARDKTHMDLNP